MGYMKPCFQTKPNNNLAWEKYGLHFVGLSRYLDFFFQRRILHSWSLSFKFYSGLLPFLTFIVLGTHLVLHELQSMNANPKVHCFFNFLFVLAPVFQFCSLKTMGTTELKGFSKSTHHCSLNGKKLEAKLLYKVKEFFIANPN